MAENYYILVSVVNIIRLKIQLRSRPAKGSRRFSSPFLPAEISAYIFKAAGYRQLKMQFSVHTHPLAYSGLIYYFDVHYPYDNASH
jgi:hypothetical protein